MDKDLPEGLAAYIPEAGPHAACPLAEMVFERPGVGLLEFAIKSRAYRCVEWLLQHGVPAGPHLTNDTYQFVPMARVLMLVREVRMAQLLIRYGAPVNGPTGWIYEDHRDNARPRFEHSLLAMAYVRQESEGDWQLARLLLCHGARLHEQERNQYPRLAAVHDIMAVRAFNCAQTCLALLARAPFQQKCLRRDWVRRYVWPRRYEQEWSPALPVLWDM